MRRECQERFPRHRLQRKPLVSDPDKHHGTCVAHVPRCMSGSLTCGGREKPGHKAILMMFISYTELHVRTDLAPMGSVWNWRAFTSAPGSTWVGLRHAPIRATWEEGRRREKNQREQSHKSHNSPAPHPTIHRFGRDMWTFLFQIGVLWDMGQVHRGIGKIGPLADYSTQKQQFDEKVCKLACSVWLYN